MHLPPLISDLAVILGVAGLVAAVFQRIRLPVVLGYLVAGLMVGTYARHFPLISDFPNVRIWADIGVIFLMFSLGLEFSFRKLSRVGVSSGLTAILEVSLMYGMGFVAARAMGWSMMESLFLAAMVSISSTTIIIKSLDELGLKSRRFAETIFGVLIVEDLIAILMMVALSTIAVTESVSGMSLLSSTGKLILVVGSWFLAGYFILPRFVRAVGRHGSDEMLTILSIGLCLFLSVLASHFGYSVALGAFIMGSILAETTESHRIEELVRPLRDLFGAVFFVSIGMLLDLRTLDEHASSIAVITAVVLVGKVLSVTLGALISGQTLRTSVQVGFGMAQIGEFSFILATLGSSLRVTQPRLYPVAVAVCLITSFTTPYMIRGSHKAATWFESHLPQSALEFLNRYALWIQERRADRMRRTEFHRLLFRWLLNGIVVSAIYIAIAELGFGPASRWMAWLLSSSCAAPFIWGMLSSFRRGSGGGGTLFFFRLATVIWVGLLSLEYFAWSFALPFTFGLVLALFALFFRQIEASYHWFESRFLSTFEPVRKTGRTTDVLRQLAPWDAHLVRIKVHPNSDIAGLRLRDAQLRSRFGMSVIAIQRGVQSLIAPQPDEQIFPKDEILVLGTDEQVEAARSHLEQPPGLSGEVSSVSDYELKNLKIPADSPVIGRSLKALGIRERFGTMIVGIERHERRILNPDAELALAEGDILWLVGELEKIDALKVAFSAST